MINYKLGWGRSEINTTEYNNFLGGFWIEMSEYIWDWGEVVVQML